MLLLFVTPEYYPEGGWKDLVPMPEVNDVTSAKMFAEQYIHDRAKENGSWYGTYHVVNTESGQIVFESDRIDK